MTHERDFSCVIPQSPSGDRFNMGSSLFREDQGRHETEARVAEALAGELVERDWVGCGWSRARTRVERWRRTLRR